ncbi:MULTISPECIES: LytR/AlgR family response regulator transcription factor [Clostridioides]|uniref:LytR/AlgR family response regulator transcription factor n=1 Tax=Clostridioides sp. ZZV14-6387 TaxID=2811497 RepID=UPI0007BB5BE1|nr:response regulator transcription factor [Clostridioides sp. ZZV14-6387]CZR95383.1 Transcriptional regulatory protein YpdB [Clostridioides difficile]CZS11190.1 Transcriptional regulatory protein YpdB [Clostridioides difficile]
MFKIAVCEDEEVQRDIIFEYIEMFLKEDKYKIFHFKNGEELLKDYIKVDVIFMDIEFENSEGRNGLDTAKEIRKIDEDVSIIFTTAFVDYALQGYKVRAFDYLVKPISYDKFESMMTKYFLEKAKEKKLIEFKIRDEIKVIKVESIVCIETSSKYIKVHTKTESFFTTTKIKDIEEDLPNEIFFRCHKSFLINLLEVRDYNNREVILGERKDIKATISYRRYNSFKEGLTSILCGKF